MARSEKQNEEMQERYERIAKVLCEGVSVADVARRFGVSTCTVQKARRSMGVSKLIGGVRKKTEVNE